jgi:hypothetical protein
LGRNIVPGRGSSKGKSLETQVLIMKSLLLKGSGNSELPAKGDDTSPRGQFRENRGPDREEACKRAIFTWNFIFFTWSFA